ncbi:hypothetical protein GALL_13740 [mine drainage metagenome]|uniref:Uncharacterized protein n=1 Tax=mine drainage metagenome TaxID=410659 RepID=A0A1J5TP76_9ZZZZ
MKSIFAAIALVLLAACHSAPQLEEDARYVKLATVVDRHEFTDVERKQAAAHTTSDSHGSIGVGLGVGSGTGGGFGFGFGGITLGMGDQHARRDEPPQIAQGADRYTVQLLHSTERIEVMSYGQYKVGDCVKVLAGHPTEYPRFFELKPGEHCE